MCVCGGGCRRRREKPIGLFLLWAPEGGGGGGGLGDLDGGRNGLLHRHFFRTDHRFRKQPPATSAVYGEYSDLPIRCVLALCNHFGSDY